MDMIDRLQKMMEVYGAAVRAGAITPQPEDEVFIRNALGLPSMQDSTVEYWASIYNVRWPVTLAEGNGEAPAMEENQQ
jgi:hypothetical protein